MQIKNNLAGAISSL